MIDQRWAIIAHLDILAALDGEAKCRLVLVDLEAGRHAGALCVAAREWEKRRDVFSIPTDDLTVSVPVEGLAAGAPTPPQQAGEVVVDTSPAKIASDPPSEEPAAQSTAVQAPPVELPDSTGGEPARRDALMARYKALHSHKKRRFKALGIVSTDLDAIERALVELEQPPKTTLERARERMAADQERTSRCRSCNAEIIWAVTATGKRMPVDAAPSANGNIHLEGTTAIVLDEPVDGARTSHFATCPNADQHRKRGKPDEGAAASEADFAPLKKAHGKLAENSRAWFTRLVKQANEAQVPFQAQACKTVRRFEIYRGVIALAGYLNLDADALDAGDEALVALVWAASGNDDATRFANVTPGHALGSLDADEAATFARLAVQLVAGDAQLIAEPDGLRFVAA